MGIYYSRCRLSSSESELQPFVAAQAIAAQSSYGWRSSAYGDTTGMLFQLLEGIHLENYLKATNALRDRLEFPPHHEQTYEPLDHPDVCARDIVSVIGGNDLYPPLWQIQAFRTLLPSELKAQLATWRSWVEDVAAGKHEEYLRYLHAYSTSDWMRQHWKLLREVAWFDPKQHTSVVRAQLVEEIIRLPEPRVWDAPITPEKFDEPMNRYDYEQLLITAKHLNELALAWNEHLPLKNRLHDESESYSFNLDEFRQQHINDQLREFFTWAQRCADLDFALFFDY